MVSHIASLWNHAVTHLELRYKDVVLGFASGFFWLAANRTFLVSNWHVFSGRDPATGQPIRDDGGLPDRVRFTVLKTESQPDGAGFYQIRPAVVEVLLCGEHWIEPRWLEHSTLKRQVDVGAIDVGAELAGYGIVVNYANVLEDDAQVQPYVSQDVFIVGYPLGLITGVPIPVWKRGTIATEPLFDLDGLPKVCIDTATREGMSGSVVLARHMIFGPYKKADGSSANTLISRRDRLLGIYSGRIGPHNVEAQLGIVWKRHVIDAVVGMGVPTNV